MHFRSATGHAFLPIGDALRMKQMKITEAEKVKAQRELTIVERNRGPRVCGADSSYFGISCHRYMLGAQRAPLSRRVRSKGNP